MEESEPQSMTHSITFRCTEEWFQALSQYRVDTYSQHQMGMATFCRHLIGLGKEADKGKKS